MTWQVLRAGPEHARGLASLFDAAGSPCFCRFWHFKGTSNEWLERCARAPEGNRAELEQAFSSSTKEARGVVAVLPSEGGNGTHSDPCPVIGWMKIAPASTVPKIYERRLYRGLPCFSGDRDGVFTIGCFLIHPDYRRQGVATELVRAAVQMAPTWGARAIEAFPRRPKEAVHDDELWTGPEGVFVKNGFVEVDSFEPYPVFRREL
jgi:GNAT superfamily N-acetyltransferase